MRAITGGCQCGAVRYRVSVALGEAVFCHCRMCQKAFGSAGAALVNAPSGHLTWTRGKPSEFRSSSIVARGFCRECGTPLYMHEDGDENFELAVGALDRPNDVTLVRQSGTESRLTWLSHITHLAPEETKDYRTADELKQLSSLQHPDHDTGHWPPK